MKTLLRFYYRVLRRYHVKMIENENIGIMQARINIQHHRAKIAITDYNEGNI